MSESQRLKASRSMVVMESGSLMSDSATHPKNALSLISVTKSGILMLVIRQAANALRPIFRMESGGVYGLRKSSAKMKSRRFG